jgi:hypothetical protein
MLETKNIIELKSTDLKDELSFSTRYLVQINFTFDLTVKSDTFLGTAHFCVRKDQIKKLCDDLTKMLSSKYGKTIIDDNDSNAFIEFEINDIGRVFINGQVGGSHEENFMKFKFSTDNIKSGKFVDDFRNLLLYIDDEKYEKEYNKKYR